MPRGWIVHVDYSDVVIDEASDKIWSFILCKASVIPPQQPVPVEEFGQIPSRLARLTMLSSLA